MGLIDIKSYYQSLFIEFGLVFVIININNNILVAGIEQSVPVTLLF